MRNLVLAREACPLCICYSIFTRQIKTIQYQVFQVVKLHLR